MSQQFDFIIVGEDLQQKSYSPSPPIAQNILFSDNIIEMIYS